MSKFVEQELAGLFSLSLPGEWGSDPEPDFNALVLRAADFTKDCKLKPTIGAPRLLPKEKLASRTLREGDLLIEKSGGSIDQPVGRVVYFNRENENQTYAYSNFLQLLRITDGFDKKFVFYLMAYLYGSGLVYRYQQQTTGIFNLKLENYLSETVSLPDCDDVRKKIRQILELIDDAIEQTEALIEKYSLVKAGMMHDLFTRGLTPDGKLRPPREEAPDLYKETPIGWIPKGWDFTTLGKAISRIDSGWSPACVEKPPSIGEWGVLKVSSVTRGSYDDQQAKTLPSNLRPKPALEVQNGDVILTRANGVAELVGKTVQVQNTQEKLMLSDKLLRLVPNKQEMTNDFLALVMVSDRIVRQIEKSMSGSSGQKNISQSQIRSFECSKPLVDEQLLISDMIRALEQREVFEVKKLSKLRLEKSALMHDLLTGEVLVKVNDLEAAHV